MPLFRIRVSFLSLSALRLTLEDSKELTRCRSPNYSQLASYVDYASSVPWTAVVSGQRLLREHLLDSCARR